MHNARTRSIRRHATSLLLSMMAGAFPTAAQADDDSDYKVLPATMCQIWGPFEENLSPAVVSDIRHAIRYTENGRVENWSPTYKVGVVCPLVRDYIDGRLEEVIATFQDNYPGPGSNGKGVLNCTLLANKKDGTASVASDYEDSEGVNGLDGDFEYPPLDGAAIDGSYTLFCGIPPTHHGAKSFIGGISYRER